MAPPLRKGRALARQRLAGVAFLVVIGLLVALTVAFYQKAFTPVVMVELKTDSIGNQLTTGGDVKIRGVRVGDIREVSTDGKGATIRLAIDEDRARQVPVGSVGQLLPKTLFGEKFVSLVPPEQPARPVREGDVLQQDRSKVMLETQKVLDDFLPLLQSLRPDDLSRTLNAVSGALRDRGDRIGANFALQDEYFKAFNPALPALQRNLQALADVADAYDGAADDFLAVLDNLSFNNRSLVDQKTQLATFLQTSTTAARSLDSFVRDNETRLVQLAQESLPSLRLYAAYSPLYECTFRGLVAAQPVTEATFGGLQPGLHITLEVTNDQKGYQRGDEPVYGDTGPTGSDVCRGLPTNAQQQADGSFIERPFPVYRTAEDGYCDEYERENPDFRDSACPRTPTQSAVRAQSQHDLLALVTAPVLGRPVDQVSDLTDLLFGPMARGTQVSLER